MPRPFRRHRPTRRVSRVAPHDRLSARFRNSFRNMSPWLSRSPCKYPTMSSGAGRPKPFTSGSQLPTGRLGQ
jgi:hypothetical protein